MVVSSDVIESIAQDLRNSQEAKRAKKLVFYVSQRYWETDFSIIDNYSFESLLEHLYLNNPTIEDLKALLFHAVDTLNRKEVYNKIAKYVLSRMFDLYDNIPSATDDEYTEVDNISENEIIRRIAENIKIHDESSRMKKLIFAACKQYWENDINVIEMYDLQELILEMRELYPSTKRLKKALDNVVSSINRQNFYSFIADTIIDELSYLYRYEAVEEINRDTSGEDEEETQLIKAQKKQSVAKETMVASDIHEDSSEIITPQEVGEDEKEIEPSVVPEEQSIPWLKIENLFDLKQEIMQYTNPLRAKIMLFYAIYEIETLEQHWSIVRTCSLDDLLVRMFEHYHTSIDVIEKKLRYVANSPIEGLEVEDNIQTVNAIVESVKHFYKKK